MCEYLNRLQSDRVVFPVQVVIGIQLLIPLLQSARSTDLFREGHNLLSPHCAICLVMLLTIFDVSLILGVYPASGPLVVVGLGHVVKEL